MVKVLPAFRPNGAAFSIGSRRIMDVTLHIGAHRTATTTFQAYAALQSEALVAAGAAFWGPVEPRRGLFADSEAEGEDEVILRAGSRLQVMMAAARVRGLQRLLVSDADFLGTIGENLETGVLYPKAGARVARHVAAFEGQVQRIILCPRSLDVYWRSLVGFGVAQGAKLPDRERLAGIANGHRSWRDVITEIAQSVPDVALEILPAERFSARPDALLAAALDVDVPRNTDRTLRNRTPQLPELRRLLAERGEDGSILPFGMESWSPFTSEEYAALREAYADDMMWLIGGADGLATLTESFPRTRAATMLPVGAQSKGHGDEREERKMARPG
ncbi:hypothetical protein [uncultured Roseobacter sp.]|uniref:hypothetical protein n=1 Tax=uncultured Roseobacter sp. TaxID=114847 RepID=UPI002609984E|nr:hypothetical protein [uncultured Roseobacter sp.]